jgi:dTDP-L-rhamnose 4-epimerase
VRALVTGGAGFVGSHVARALLARGDDVAILDSLDARVHGGAPELPPQARFVHGDVGDGAAVSRALGGGVDVVFHEAAMVGVGRGALDAEAYVSTNVVGTARLMSALARAPRPPERIVLASTVALYGEGAYECPSCGGVSPAPRRRADLDAGRWDVACARCGAGMAARALTEEHAARPATMYAISKLAQEQCALSLARDLDLPVVALRYHNVYGPGMPRGTPYAGVASFFKSRLLAGEPPVVHEDGAQLRDFVRVEDVARANLLAADAPLDRVAGEAFNVASGEPRSVLDFALALCAALRPDLKPSLPGTYRAGDARHVHASIGKARRVLSFEPRVGFAEGLRRFAREPTREAPAHA